MTSKEGPTLAWRLLRWLFLILSVPASSQSAAANEHRLGPFEYPQPRELTIPQAGQRFSAYEALNGSFSSPEHCANVPNGLWVEVDGKGDCIRHYTSGLFEDGNPDTLIYLGGDVMLRTSKGVRFIGGSYLKQSPATIEADMAEWSAQAGKPVIYLARPGIHGSSGDHNQRRHEREIALMDRTIDMLKKRYKISSLILTGHSAGGQIVGGLLNRRTDIAAAVITSGLVSVKQVSAFWERKRKIPGRLLYNAKNFYDPVSEIGRIPTDSRPEIYVISDPEDRVVPFYSQLFYVRKLRAAGFTPHHIFAMAPDKQRHLLALNGRLAAALIARQKSSKEIRRALNEYEIERAE